MVELWKNCNLHLGVVNLITMFLPPHNWISYLNFAVAFMCLMVWWFIDLPSREQDTTTQNNIRSN